MPLRDFACEVCGRTEERFYHAQAREPLRCAGCGSDVLTMTANLASGRAKTGVFPFDVQVDGQTIRVDDIGSLRRMERTYGVLATAFSQNPNNPDSPGELPETRPGGRAYEGLRLRDYVKQRQAEGLRAAIRAVETGRYR